MLDECGYSGIDSDDSDYFILHDTSRSYGSMGVGISGFVVSASCMVVAVKGMREEQREGREYLASSLMPCETMGHVFLSRCLIP